MKSSEKVIDYFGVFEDTAAKGGTVYYVKTMYTDGSSVVMPTDRDIHTKARATRHAQAYTNACGCKNPPKDMTVLPQVP